jgi:hypothetical protein
MGLMLTLQLMMILVIMDHDYFVWLYESYMHGVCVKMAIVCVETQQEVL